VKGRQRCQFKTQGSQPDKQKSRLQRKNIYLISPAVPCPVLPCPERMRLPATRHSCNAPHPFVCKILSPSVSFMWHSIRSRETREAASLAAFQSKSEPLEGSPEGAARQLDISVFGTCLAVLAPDLWTQAHRGILSLRFLKPCSLHCTLPAAGCPQPCLPPRAAVAQREVARVVVVGRLEAVVVRSTLP
jgi:hypothetical protein